MKDPKEKSGLRPVQTMVRLSLAVAALMPLPHAAMALDVKCTRDIQWGPFATCGGGAQITITPQATSKVNTGAGCAVLLGTPQRGLCKVISLTSTTTGSLKIQMTAKAASLKKAGATMAISKFNIDTKAGGPTKLYLPSKLTTKTFVFGVGARMNAGAGQAIGAYSGQITMMVTYTP